MTIAQELQRAITTRELEFCRFLASFKVLAAGIARTARAKQCCEGCRLSRAQVAAQLDAALDKVESLVVPFLALAKPYEVDVARVLIDPNNHRNGTTTAAILTIEELARHMTRAIDGRNILD